MNRVNESGVGKNKRDMGDELHYLFNKAHKEHNASAVIYYNELIQKFNDGSLKAFTAFENFINAYAGHNWMKKNEKRIKDFAEEQRRRFQKKYKIVYPREYNTVVSESWNEKMHTAKKDKGMFNDRTLASLKKEKATLDKKENKTAADSKKLKQVNFAIRAKQKNKWGKISESVVKEERVLTPAEMKSKKYFELLKEFDSFLKQHKYRFVASDESNPSSREYVWAKDFADSSYKVVVEIGDRKDEVLVSAKLHDEKPYDEKVSKKFILFKKSEADVVDLKQFKEKIKSFLSKIDDEELFESKKIVKENTLLSYLPKRYFSNASKLAFVTLVKKSKEYGFNFEEVDAPIDSNVIKLRMTKDSKFIDFEIKEQKASLDEPVIKMVVTAAATYKKEDRYLKTKSYELCRFTSFNVNVRGLSKQIDSSLKHFIEVIADNASLYEGKKMKNKNVIKESLDNFISDNQDNRKLRLTVSKINQLLKGEGYQFLIAQRESRDSGLSKMWELRWAKNVDENKRNIVTIEVHTSPHIMTDLTIIGRGFITEKEPFGVIKKVSAWLYRDNKDGKFDPIVVLSHLENMLGKLTD